MTLIYICRIYGWFAAFGFPVALMFCSNRLLTLSGFYRRGLRTGFQESLDAAWGYVGFKHSEGGVTAALIGQKIRAISSDRGIELKVRVQSCREGKR